MKLFGPFYAALCYSRRQKGLPISDTPFDGNLLLALSMFMLVGSSIATVALLFPAVQQVVLDITASLFGKEAGHVAGKIAAFGGVFFFYWIAKTMVGTEAKYQRLMDDCEIMSLEELKQLSRKGAWMYAFMLGSVIVPILIWYIKSDN